MEQAYVACNAAGLDRLRILVQQVSDDELGREIAGGWTVYPRKPDHLPRREEELPALSLEERLIALARLADQDIVDASLGDHDPHLIRVDARPSAKGPSEWFTGTVRIDPLFEAHDPARQRRQRHVRARRPHRLLHPPAGPDPDRDGGRQT